MRTTKQAVYEQERWFMCEREACKKLFRFTRNRRRGHMPKYCSNACKQKAYRERKQEASYEG